MFPLVHAKFKIWPICVRGIQEERRKEKNFVSSIQLRKSVSLETKQVEKYLVM
jgi:hypothetical protein